MGDDANPLIFPNGATPHNTFQAGEFDLFLTSKLSRTLSFTGKIVLGSDSTNVFSVNIQRYQWPYKPTEYFKISGGRYHSSATGSQRRRHRDRSGTENWKARIALGSGSGERPRIRREWSGSPEFSLRNRKAFNIALYARPAWGPGLQVGASFYDDRLAPSGLLPVTQHISSEYAVYTNEHWELLNEAVLLNNKMQNNGAIYNTPLMYTQISRAFGMYRPYFRYQYVNVPHNDPVNVFTGRYQGPSAGFRMDFTTYVALKLQYNRLYQRQLSTLNGLDMQMAFTF